MCSFGPDQKIRIEKNRCDCAPRPIHANWNCSATLSLQISVHTKGDRDVVIVRQVHRSKRNWLQRIFGTAIAKHRYEMPFSAPIAAKTIT